MRKGKSMKFSKIYKALGVLIVLVFLFFFFSKKEKATQQPNNAETILKRQDLTQKVTISGQVWPKKRLDIKPPFSGYIEKIFVKTGEKVKAGSPLITFSPSLSKGENNHPLRAAFNGVVTQIIKTEGEYVTETSDQNLVMRVDDLDELFVLANVPELDVAKLKIGQEASIRISSLISELFKGSISEISLSAKEKDRYTPGNTEFQVKVLLKSHDPRLMPGMSAMIDVITNKANNVLALPHEYIQEQDNKYFVTLTNGERKDITLGLQTDEAAEVKSGLNEGDKIKIVDFLNSNKSE